MAYESTIKPAPLATNTPVYWLTKQPVTGHAIAPGFKRWAVPAPEAEDLDYVDFPGITYQPIWPIPGAVGIQVTFQGEGRRYSTDSFGVITHLRHFTIFGTALVTTPVYLKVTPEQARKILCRETIYGGGAYPGPAADAAKITLLIGVPWIKAALSCVCNWTLENQAIDPVTHLVTGTSTTSGTVTAALHDYYGTLATPLDEPYLSPLAVGAGVPTSAGVYNFGLIDQTGVANSIIPQDALVTPVGGSSHWGVDVPYTHPSRGVDASMVDDYTVTLAVV